MVGEHSGEPGTPSVAPSGVRDKNTRKEGAPLPSPSRSEHSPVSRISSTRHPPYRSTPYSLRGKSRTKIHARTLVEVSPGWMTQ